MRRKKIILSAGGTGGHLFPAQALARQLVSNYDLLFVAGGLATSFYFDRKKYAFQEIPTATFALNRPLEILQGGKKIYQGMRKSLRILDEFDPDLVIGFGSYFTLPLLLASLKKKIPFILHEQNAIPGKVNRYFSRFAQLTAVTFPDSIGFLKGKIQEVRYPLKSYDPISKKEALDYYGRLHEGKKTLLVFGGSQGGRGINQLFLEAISFLDGSFQILHFTGKHDNGENICKTYAKSGIVAVVKSFEEKMEYAWALADFAITRAGAGTIAELVEFEKPALLVPFPYASENHQVKNGQFFTEKVQGGTMLFEHGACGHSLAEHLLGLIDREELYRESIRRFKSEQKKGDLAHIIQSYIK
jgi:UDP-N-acetylglucosamine--N-acetylmuramyl-(pentapeptide) pyrophosphoryl-undecaprenol N-acetylglucosamine transferase